jgi:anti-sigma factor RsiW
MTCQELVDLLLDYVAGELADHDAERLREHLKECPPCVYYVQTYELTIRLSRRLPTADPPAQLLDRLRAAAQEE